MLVLVLGVLAIVAVEGQQQGIHAANHGMVRIA
jgi:hypothetical protein